MAIGTLNGFTLITQEIRETQRIHPLVQASVHYWLEQKGEKTNYTSQALQLRAERFPYGEHENKRTCELMLTHAQAVLCYDCESKDDLGRRAVVLFNVRWFNWKQGRFDFACREVSEAYNIYQEQVGEVATTTLKRLCLLASVLGDQGEYGTSEKMNRRAPAAREKVLGVEHSDTLFSLANLALVLRDQREYEASEEMNRRALKGRERVLGSKHPDTLTSLSILAWALRDQGKYEASKEMNRRALEGYEKVLGVEHLDTLTSPNNLALVLRDQGKYEAAEEMNRRALEVRRNRWESSIPTH